MPDTYIDSSIQTGMNDANFDIQKDTLGRMDAIINKPAITLNDVYPQQEQSPIQANLPKVKNYLDALHSDDYRIYSLGQNYLNNKLAQDPGTRLGVGQSIDVPYTDPSNPGKFINKKYGYDYRDDNEDYYYKHDYLSNNAIYRNAILNPLRFIGRVAGGTVAKLGEGLGYMGAMITSIGSENYMENVADNSFSKWFEKQEQSFKDKVIPVYKQAGFDEKGFFSKLGDWTFWNDSVADGVSFMAAAIAQSYLVGGLANLTRVGQLGSIGINTASKLGKIGKGIDFAVKTFTGAEDLGGIGNWAFNTASEAAFEMKGVYTETKQDLLDQRSQGKNNYSDEEIGKIASQRAASDFRGNLLALSVSNAFENKFIFQPIKKAISGAEGAAVGKLATTIGEDGLIPEASEKVFNYSTKLGKFTDWKNPMGKIQFYGKRATEAAFMEGLYEENVQLAIERMARAGQYENKSVPEAIFSTAQKTVDQARNAFAGNDKEAAESIGLGALIGIGGTSIVSKIIGGGKNNPLFTGERRAEMNEARVQMEHYNNLRRDFLNMRDVFKQGEDGKHERDEEGNLVYDEEKINARAEGLKQFTEKARAAEAVSDPVQRQMMQDDLLSDFVHAASRAGILSHVQEHVGNIENKSIDEITELGFNPAETVDIQQFRSHFDNVVKAHEEAFASTVAQPKGVKTPEYAANEEARKYVLFKSKALQLSTENAYNEVNRVLTDDQVATAPSPFSPQAAHHDPTVRQYNSTVLQQKQLEQFAEMAKENGDFYNDYIEQKGKELENERKSLEESLADKVQDGSLKNINGLLVGKDVKASRANEEINADLVKKHASFKNSLDQWKYTSDKLSSLQNGYKNFQAYREYQDNIVANDVNQDTEGEVDNTPNEVPPPPPPVDTADTTTTTTPELPTDEKPVPTPEEQPEDVEEVANVDNDKNVVNDPSFIDTSNPISYDTPLKTTSRESVASTENEETLVDDSYNQVVSLFVKGIATYGAGKKAYIVNDREEWLSRFPEKQREEARAALGQVILFETEQGTLKVGDIPSFAANPKFKQFLSLPIVLSFTKGDEGNTGFNVGLEQRALTKANKLKVPVADILSQYTEEKQRITDVRNFLVTNRNDKVPVSVVASTEGIYPRTKSAAVVDRFGGAFTIKVSTLLNGLHQYKPGTIVADFGDKGTLPVTTRKISTTAVAANLKELYNFQFATEEEANKVRDYFKSLVYTTTSRFFKVQEYTGENGKYYMVNFLDKERPNITDRKGSMENMLSQNLNVNNKILTGKKSFMQWSIEDKKLTSQPIQTDQYNNFIKENLITTIKKVTLNGELYTGRVNPYFTFSVDDARFKQTANSKAYARYQKMIDANATMTEEGKDTSIQTINADRKLTKDEKQRLIKQIQDKPTLAVKEDTPDLSNEEAAKLFGSESEIDRALAIAPQNTLYGAITKDNIEGVLKETAQQAHSSESEKSGAVAMMGQEFVDLATRINPAPIKNVEKELEEVKEETKSEPDAFVPAEDLSNLFGNFGEEDDIMNSIAKDDKPLSSAEQTNNKTENNC